MIRTETVTKTYCTACGEELRDHVDFSLHRRKHHLEYWYREAPHIMEMLKKDGFKDEPDDPALRRRYYGEDK